MKKVCHRPRKASQPAMRAEGGGACGRLLCCGLLMMAGTGYAQEGLRNALTAQASRTAQRSSMEGLPYTVRLGDLRLLAGASAGLDWNDNAILSQNSREQDFILRPMANVAGTYPLTKGNLFSFSVSGGYEKYFEHDEHSTWQLQTGSNLGFDLYIKDVWINLHDRFSYSRRSAQEAAVANTAEYGNFNNSAGVFSQWDLRDVVLSAGYDHLNVLSGSQDFQTQDRTTELGLLRAGARLHPSLTAGVEATGTLTSYDAEYLNDSLGYSVGGYAEVQIGTGLQIQPRAGYAKYFMESTSRLLPASDQSTWYVDLTVIHRLTETVSYTFSAGREIRPGVYSEFIEDYYVRPSISWYFIKDTSLSTSFSYEHGEQRASNFAGTGAEIYDWYSAGISLSRQITQRMTASLRYQITLRSSDSTLNSGFRDYTQNVVGIQVSYRF